MNIAEIQKLVEDTVEKVLYQEAAEFLPFAKDKIKEAIEQDRKVKVLRTIMENNGYVDKYSATVGND